MTFAEHVIQFFENLRWKAIQGFEDISPLVPLSGEHENDVRRIIHSFYNKFYNDQHTRKMIIGINPGRLGAGSTGIPFTDTTRLKQFCDIEPGVLKTHEPSSVFMYKMIEAFGGAQEFYNQFYITSVCPIGFTKINLKGKAINWNYYDDKIFARALEPFIQAHMVQQLNFGIDSTVAFCLGAGKNFQQLNELNEKHGWFKRIIALEHPRYVMQYKFQLLESYVESYLQKLSS
jgi:hypothetical protein